MKYTTLVILLLTTVSGLAQDKPTKEPADLVKAREIYEAKIKAAVDPITAAYLKHLDAMKKAYGAKGELESALAVQKEIDSLTTSKPKSAITIVGSWVREDGFVLEIHEDGTAKWHNVDMGKWKCLDKKTRKYQVAWSPGSYEWLVMSSDGATLAIKNSKGETHTAQRMPSDVKK